MCPPAFFEDGELTTRRALLALAEQGDQAALQTLKVQYNLLYWGKGDRTILM